MILQQEDWQPPDGQPSIEIHSSFAAQSWLLRPNRNPTLRSEDLQGLERLLLKFVGLSEGRRSQEHVMLPIPVREREGKTERRRQSRQRQCSDLVVRVSNIKGGSIIAFRNVWIPKISCTKAENKPWSKLLKKDHIQEVWDF